ncbi:hypothetical protein BpHYR1_044172 [Brachionus plicatilis]|uniref:Uncharacterized protein n=1 Tax=Brachionus plicatilis TaxID=10195 RepID=A0A3M7QGC0_BRAPC|nr:hypothetical protein BpHYR1_044172 [Brachionus plicatilis]
MACILLQNAEFLQSLAYFIFSIVNTVFPCSIMQRHNLEHIIGAGAILNLAHVKFNLTCVACAKTHHSQDPGYSASPQPEIRFWRNTVLVLSYF